MKICARRLNLETPNNLRDLGGHMRKDKKVTKFNEFLRSDAMSELSKGDIEFLKEFGLKTVIDLRTDLEISRKPNDFENIDWVNYINIPLATEEQLKIDGKDFTLRDFYIDLLNKSENFGNLFNYMAENPDGVILFHCTAGKDRAGLTAALLLLNAGISKPDVVADYEVSFTYYKQSLLEQLKIYPDMPIHFAHSESEWLENFISHLENDYGTVENFMLEKGVSKEKKKILRDKLI